MKGKRLTMRMLMTSTLAICLTCVATLSGCPGANNAPIPGETRTFDGIEFQWCPAGTFTMGSPDSETGHQSYESPQHQVRISHGFWLGKYEVTQAQWQAVMGSNPSASPQGDTKPVDTVSWDDIEDFLAALNAGMAPFGGRYRLPTESEWEYACRAGTTTRFYWGDDPTYTAIGDYAWHDTNSSDQTHNVGEKLPNTWGLYDVAGNVWEWCRDWGGDYPPGPVTDPQGPASSLYRVQRGGSFFDFPVSCRAAQRGENGPSGGNDNVGFRLLRTQW